MGYRLVADAAMVAHFAFLAYLVLGGFIAWVWPRTLWTHVAAALYGLFNLLIGWPCPLTHVENWGRTRAGEATLPGTGFIDHYLADVVYPTEHESLVQGVAALVVLASWVGFTVRHRHHGTSSDDEPRA
ncbi:DUF2784 domain-containing protein [Knoellia aerolata]|uniref:Membrane protein n=1 Tax=Knoellia aerolata DSM 18566 TaxID=1385519 RepID=A0A0A0K000_9MICO|nr:DUF2784 domain-containing protein [Knoellia aerolata]KGN42995.1 membrane protein [Knoellia aerolata DSM 18566]